MQDWIAHVDPVAVADALAIGYDEAEAAVAAARKDRGDVVIQGGVAAARVYRGGRLVAVIPMTEAGVRAAAAARIEALAAQIREGGRAAIVEVARAAEGLRAILDAMAAAAVGDEVTS